MVKRTILPYSYVMNRRGEGGRCGEGRAFMVARGVGRWSCFRKISVR